MLPHRSYPLARAAFIAFAESRLCQLNEVCASWDMGGSDLRAVTETSVLPIRDHLIRLLEVAYREELQDLRSLEQGGLLPWQSDEAEEAAVQLWREQTPIGSIFMEFLFVRAGNSRHRALWSRMVLGQP